MLQAADPTESRFRTRPCSGLEEQRRMLCELRPGVPGLELSPTWARSGAFAPRCWLFEVVEQDRALDVAAATLGRSRIRLGLHVVLSGRPLRIEAMVAGIRAFARQERATRIAIETLGLAESVVPPLEGETARIRSDDYIVDLREGDPLPSFSKNHRRNIRRAQEAGVERILLPANQAAREHVRLVHASLGRRSGRGEFVGRERSERGFLPFVEAGNAWFHQVGLGGRVLSSNLVMRVGDAGYYLSGGTDPEGMKIGCSHFLYYRMICEAASRGCRTLCLGYPNRPDLARYKEGFGARAVAAERVEASWPLPAERALRRVLGWLRR
jgi:hypothetical protein